MVFRSCLQIFGYQDVEADGVLIDAFVMYCADASPYLVLWDVSGLSTPCINLPCKILRLAERFGRPRQGELRGCCRHDRSSASRSHASRRQDSWGSVVLIPQREADDHCWIDYAPPIRRVRAGNSRVRVPVRPCWPPRQPQPIFSIHEPLLIHYCCFPLGIMC